MGGASSHPQTKVVICGGGLAGLTCARMLDAYFDFILIGSYFVLVHALYTSQYFPFETAI